MCGNFLYKRYGMKRSKIIVESELLKRNFHCDYFSVGDDPSFSAIFIGGSGVDKIKYESRFKTIIDVFDESLSELESEGYSFNFTYYTAPYDIPYGKLDEFQNHVDYWNEHFLKEVLSEIENKIMIPKKIPIYLMAYSGGAVLILSGLQSFQNCFGAGLLGADGLNDEMTIGEKWKKPITIYYNLQDPVFHSNTNSLDELVTYGDLIFYRTLNGSHSLKDYIKNNSFSGLIRRANRLLTI